MHGEPEHEIFVKHKENRNHDTEIIIPEFTVLLNKTITTIKTIIYLIGSIRIFESFNLY